MWSIEKGIQSIIRHLKNKCVNMNTIYCLITFHSICITNSYISNTFQKLKKLVRFTIHLIFAVLISIQSSIFLYRYQYMDIHIYTRIYIKKFVIYPSLLLSNKSMHQRFVDVDDNHYQLSYLEHILKLLINDCD